MNKTVIISLILLCLTLNASAQAFNCLVECDIKVLDVHHEIKGDDITVFVKFKRVGGGIKKCGYDVLLKNMFGRVINREPDSWDFLDWKFLETDEEAEISVSTHWIRPTVCDFPSGVLGTGNYVLEIRGHNANECNFPVGSYLFASPSFCCGVIQGISCLDYGLSYGGFTCNESVQINPNVGCLVRCEYDSRIDDCSCILIDACAIACVLEEKSYCAYGDFICMGSHYKCPSGDEPEVKCSTTRDCKYQCAAECGKRTTCVGDCENCCKSPANCGKVSPYPYEKYELDVCMEACMGICRANEELCKIIYILGGIAVAVSVFLIMVHGIKWMTSDDFEGRQDAKRGIAYVFMGLVIVMIATALANYFFIGSLVC